MNTGILGGEKFGIYSDGIYRHLGDGRLYELRAVLYDRWTEDNPDPLHEVVHEIRLYLRRRDREWKNVKDYFDLKRFIKVK